MMTESIRPQYLTTLQMFVAQPRPWQILSLVILMVILILQYYDRMVVLNPALTHQWWGERFSGEEKAGMSQVGRWIFLSEVPT